MLHRHGGDIYTYGKVYDFSANINFRGMPEPVRSAAVQAVDASVHYPDPEYRTLRRALAGREGIAQTDHMICGNGAAELMFALSAAYRPKNALLAAPSFFEYEQALASSGCAVRRFCLKKEDGFEITGQFLDAIDETTDCMILGNPNNPTGRTLSGEFLEELLRICRERGILLVMDESFFDFLSEEDRAGTFSCAERTAEYENLFVIKSFTKMYAMPGLRFGYGICGNKKLLERMHAVMQPWNVSVPAAQAAQAAASETAFAEETAIQTRKNREALFGALLQAGYRVYPSSANFLLFEGPEDLQDFCLEHGFLIRDCSNFPGLARGFFRICVRSREENEKILNVLWRAKENG